MLRQLSSLAFENLYQFSQHQLLLLMRGLGRLRFLTPANCEVLLQHFKIDASSREQSVQDGDISNGWTPHRNAMLLGALALCDVGPTHQDSLSALMPLLQHVEKALEQPEAANASDGRPGMSQRHHLGLAALVEAAYAICYFQLQGEPHEGDIRCHMFHYAFTSGYLSTQALSIKIYMYKCSG